MLGFWNPQLLSNSSGILNPRSDLRVLRSPIYVTLGVLLWVSTIFRHTQTHSNISWELFFFSIETAGSPHLGGRRGCLGKLGGHHGEWHWRLQEGARVPMSKRAIFRDPHPAGWIEHGPWLFNIDHTMTGWWWLEPWIFSWLSMKSWECHIIPTYPNWLSLTNHHFSEGFLGQPPTRYDD